MKKSEMLYLEHKALDIRKKTIRMVGNLGVGHIGGAMSVVEILVYLHYKAMNTSPETMNNMERDRLVMSKGHAGPTLYSILADRGYFPEEWLSTLNKGGTALPSHCDMNLTPGIDFTTGSLGQGSSSAAGLALGCRMKGIDNTTYLLMGDGEIQEGQVWEAAMFSAHQKLDNLIGFIDYNKLQLDGTLEEILSPGDLAAKWKSFGWFTQQIDGHCFRSIEKAVSAAQKMKGMPSMIILDTQKSRGYCFGEETKANHNMAFDMVKAEEAIAELERRFKVRVDEVGASLSSSDKKKEASRA